MPETLEEVGYDTLRSGRLRNPTLTALHLLNQRKVLDGQGWHRCPIETCNLVQHLDRLRLASLAEQKLWRLIEPEDHYTQEEHRERHGTEDDHLISPAHVAAHSTACLAGPDSTAGGELRVAAPLGGRAVRNG